MNRIFLLIPVVGDGDAGKEIAYLRQLGKIDNEEAISILRRIVQSLKLVKEEDVEVLYDAQYLNRLMCRRTGKSSDQEMPQLENLLVFFNDAVSIQDLGLGLNPVTINGMKIGNGLVNAFVGSGRNEDTLLNKEALTNPERPIEVEDVDGRRLRLSVLTCEATDVYLWLVEKRMPQRRLDPNCKKHRVRKKTGKKGVQISPLTYTEQQLVMFLKRAVVAKKGLRELYFKDSENNKIIIFWDEHLEQPSYHAMEIDANNDEELQKIYKRGGRDLISRIEKTAELMTPYSSK